MRRISEVSGVVKGEIRLPESRRGEVLPEHAFSAWIAIKSPVVGTWHDRY